MKLFCECNSMSCNKMIEMNKEEALKFVNRDRKEAIISDNCHHGPESTEILVSQKDGYCIYKER